MTQKLSQIRAELPRNRQLCRLTAQWTEISWRRIYGVSVVTSFERAFWRTVLFTVSFGGVLSMSAAFFPPTFYSWEKMRKFDTSAGTFFRMFI